MLTAVGVLAMFAGRLPALREKARTQAMPSPVISLGLAASHRVDR